MKVGDLVKQHGWDGFGVVTCIDPEEAGDTHEVEVFWSDGEVGNMSCDMLEIVNENR